MGELEPSNSSFPSSSSSSSSSSFLPPDRKDDVPVLLNEKRGVPVNRDDFSLGFPKIEGLLSPKIEGLLSPKIDDFLGDSNFPSALSSSSFFSPESDFSPNIDLPLNSPESLNRFPSPLSWKSLGLSSDLPRFPNKPPLGASPNKLFFSSPFVCSSFVLPIASKS